MATLKIDLSAKSWEKAKPGDVKGDKLSSALKSAEKALADEKKNGDAPSIEACLAAIQATSSAVDDAIKKECDAKKHKDLITALKKLQSDCESEVKRLKSDHEKAKKDEEGDEDEDDENCSDDELLSPKQFKVCIKKAKLKGNAQDGVSFCLGVHKKAEECKLVFMKKKGFAKQTFKRLYGIAKDNPSLGLQRPKMTYGSAFRDPVERDTLVLQITDGAPTEIPGMARKLEKWRKKFKQDLLPFKEISLRAPSGEPLAMTPDPDEEEEGLLGAADGAEAAATASVGSPQASPSSSPAPAPAPTPGSTAAPQQQAAAAPPAEDQLFEDRRKEFRKARRAWQGVKDQAVQDLEAVKDGIRDYYLDDPEQFKIATGKLKQLDVIMDNLGDDLRDVLDKYVSTPKSRGAEMQQLADQARTTVEQFLQYAQSDKLLNAVDQKEFADVTVKAPIEKALKDLVKTLS
ncbi:MAG: hypothetical protein ACRCT8_03810 [Lacipirellulaceae bacterium]